VFLNSLIGKNSLISGSFLYLVHFNLSKLWAFYNTTVFRWYFGDYLALVVCIPLIINIQVYFGFRQKCCIKIIEIFIYFIIFSISFEIILPIILKKTTSDVIDIIAYAFGGMVLYLVENILTIKIRHKK
jgi:hypothetical protein